MNSSESERTQLDSLMQDGDEQVLDFLRRAVPPDLRSTIDEDDLLQEVRLEMSRYISRVDLSNHKSSLQWVLRVAKSKLIDAIRAERALKRGRGQRTANHAPANRSWRREMVAHARSPQRTPSSTVAAREAVQLVMEKLDSLDDREREMIRLYFLEDLSDAEIAERFECPLPTVRGVLWRARKKLAERLGGSFNFYSDA